MHQFASISVLHASLLFFTLLHYITLHLHLHYLHYITFTLLHFFLYYSITCLTFFNLVLFIVSNTEILYWIYTSIQSHSMPSGPIIEISPTTLPWILMQFDKRVHHYRCKILAQCLL